MIELIGGSASHFDYKMYYFNIDNILSKYFYLEIHNDLHRQQIKSKQRYLKQHSKAFNSYKLKGCRIRQ